MNAAAAIARPKDSVCVEQDSPANPAAAIIEKFRLQRSVFLCVEGHSMWPSIRPRDIVFVQRAEIDHISAGQIVAFARENRVIIHRVLSKTQKQQGKAEEIFLVTKGDALDASDFPVSSDELLGAVTRIHRDRRHIDLESIRCRLMGKLIAQISPFSRVAYTPARLLRAIHRIFVVEL